jgi:L-2-aminoadipate reductase
VTPEIVGVYLAYLVELGFMASPSGKGERSLPKIVLEKAQREALVDVGGRTGTA